VETVEDRALRQRTCRDSTETSALSAAARTASRDGRGGDGGLREGECVCQ
jgi:hypothetical protein